MPKKWGAHVLTCWSRWGLDSCTLFSHSVHLALKKPATKGFLSFVTYSQDQTEYSGKPESPGVNIIYEYLITVKNRSNLTLFSHVLPIRHWDRGMGTH